MWTIGRTTTMETTMETLMETLMKTLMKTRRRRIGSSVVPTRWKYSL